MHEERREKKAKGKMFFFTRNARKHDERGEKIEWKMYCKNSLLGESFLNVSAQNYFIMLPVFFLCYLVYSSKMIIHHNTRSVCVFIHFFHAFTCLPLIKRELSLAHILLSQFSSSLSLLFNFGFSAFLFVLYFENIRLITHLFSLHFLSLTKFLSRMEQKVKTCSP